MTSTLPALLGHLRRAYPTDLPTGGLTRLLYLADWCAALRLGRQITALRWRLDGFGPAADDLRLEPSQASVTAEERAVLDHVVRTAAGHDEEELERLVYSTYPAIASDRYTELDLVVLAKEYRQELAIVESRQGAAEGPGGDHLPT